MRALTSLLSLSALLSLTVAASGVAQGEPRPSGGDADLVTRTLQNRAGESIEFLSSRTAWLSDGGEGAQLEVRVIDASGRAVPGAKVEWESSDPRFAVRRVGPLSAFVTSRTRAAASAVVRAFYHGAETDAVAMSVVLQPGTVHIDSSLIKKQAAGGLLLARTPETVRLVPGQVLLGDERSGLLVRIRAIEPRGNAMAVYAVPARLVDAFEQLSATSKITIALPNPGGIQCGFAGSFGAADISSMPNLSLSSRLEIDGGRVTLFELVERTQGQFTATFSVTDNASNCTIRPPIVRSRTVSAFGIFSLRLDVASLLSFSAAVKPRHLAHLIERGGVMTVNWLGGARFTRAGGWEHLHPDGEPVLTGAFSPVLPYPLDPSFPASFSSGMGGVGVEYDTNIVAQLGSDLVESLPFEVLGFSEDLKVQAPSSPFPIPSWFARGTVSDSLLPLIGPLLDRIGLDEGYVDLSPSMWSIARTPDYPTIETDRDTIDVARQEAILMTVRTKSIASGTVEFLFSPSNTGFTPLSSTSLDGGSTSFSWVPPSHPRNYPSDVFYVTARVKDTDPVSHFWPYQANVVRVSVDFTP